MDRNPISGDLSVNAQFKDCGQINLIDPIRQQEDPINIGNINDIINQIQSDLKFGIQISDIDLINNKVNEINNSAEVIERHIDYLYFRIKQCNIQRKQNKRLKIKAYFHKMNYYIVRGCLSVVYLLAPSSWK